MYQTNRLLLTVLDKSSNKQVADYYNRNREFLKPWELERREMFFTSDFQKIQLDRDFSYIRQEKMLILWIFKKNEPEKIIGNVSFTNIVRGNFLSCTLGYKMDVEELNKGYMTEAIEKGIDIIFNDYALHRIEAHIMVSNKRSLRVLEKLKFSVEGLSKSYLKVNGKWQDHINMVLLNEYIV